MFPIRGKILKTSEQHRSWEKKCIVSCFSGISSPPSKEGGFPQPACAAGVAGLPQPKAAFSFKLLQGHKARSILLIV